MLSDYRVMILLVGLLGMSLSIIAYLSILSRTTRSLAIAMFLAYLLVLLHRSWMLYEPYLYTFALFSVIVGSKSLQKVGSKNDNRKGAKVSMNYKYK